MNIGQMLTPNTEKYLKVTSDRKRSTKYGTSGKQLSPLEQEMEKSVMPAVASKLP